MITNRRIRVDFLRRPEFRLEGCPYGAEGLWAIHHHDDVYEVDNVPFFTTAFSCGDLVRCIEEDGLLEVVELVRVEASKRFLIQAHSEEAFARLSAELLERFPDVKMEGGMGFLTVQVPTKDAHGVEMWTEADAADDILGLEIHDVEEVRRWTTPTKDNR